MSHGQDDRIWTDIPRDDADLLAALVRSSNDAIYSKDAQARITSWNPAAQDLYGYTADEVFGQPISILIPEDRRGEELDILNQILQGAEIEHYETVRVRKDGSNVEVSISVSPDQDTNGRIVKAAVIARDISERKRAQRHLATSQRKQALELDDAVVQGLATAKMALEMSNYEQGLRTVATTLESAKKIVSRLLEGAGAWTLRNSFTPTRKSWRTTRTTPDRHSSYFKRGRRQGALRKHLPDASGYDKTQSTVRDVASQ